MKKEKEYIQLNNSDDVLTLWIRTREGVETGECLTFDMEDIELLDTLEKMRIETRKNHNWINNQLAIIDKKQDFTKKGEIMSNNTKETYYAIKSFYKKQKDIFDMFLGKGGVDKLLYGRKFEWTTIEEILKIINEVIAPKLGSTTENVINKIKGKYNTSKEEDVLE